LAIIELQCKNIEQFNQLDATSIIIATAIAKNQDVFQMTFENQGMMLRNLHSKVDGIYDAIKVLRPRRTYTFDEIQELTSQMACWLSPLDFPRRQVEIFEQMTKNTGKWLLNSKQYQVWSGIIDKQFEERDDENEDSSALWCTGDRESIEIWCGRNES
jgi:hypothetical protein